METKQNRKPIFDGKTGGKSCKKNTNSELNNERSTEEDEKESVRPVFYRNWLPNGAPDVSKTYLLIFLMMMHDSSYWCAIGGEQYISQCFTTFTYSTEAKVMMEWVQCIMVDTDLAIISRRTPEMFTALMFRRCGEQNYVPDLVVQCVHCIIQIVLWHTYTETRKPLHYHSLSVNMFKFFQKLKLPHLLKQVILSVYELLKEGHPNIDLHTLRNGRVTSGGHMSVSLCNIY